MNAVADMCYECQFSNNGYFCRFMEHGVCTATSCKRMVEIEERIALNIRLRQNSFHDICKLLNGGEANEKDARKHVHTDGAYSS